MEAGASPSSLALRSSYAGHASPIGLARLRHDGSTFWAKFEAPKAP
jgi:hypothetical protein